MTPHDGTATELPPYRALVVVDMEEFSGEQGRDHARLTEAIPEILRQTLVRCGLGELWNEVRFQGSTGDGYFLGFDSRLLPFLLNPFISALQDELAYQNTVSSQTVRMRVNINVGPMTDSSTNLISDGSGDARIEAHRLLDSEPVRDLLTRSGSVTCVAAIVSARAFADAVLSGFSDEDPELYVPTPVRVKSYQGTAYLRVPRPSGELLTGGFVPGKQAESDTGEAPPPQEENGGADRSSISDHSIGNVQGTGHKMHTGDEYSGPQYHGEVGRTQISGDVGTVQHDFRSGR